MEWLKNWWYGEPVDVNKNIVEIDGLLSTIYKKISLLEKKRVEEDIKAQDFLRKNDKKNVMICLKRKKMHEEAISKLTNQIMNQEKMKNSLEDVALDTSILDTSKKTANTMKKSYKNKKVEDIEKDMDELQDVMEDAKTISDVINRPIIADVHDEEDLLEEFQMSLEENKLNKVETEQNCDIKIPTNDINVNTKKEEEDELKKLMDEMNN